MTTNCLNGVWRKLLPGFISGSNEEENINEEVIRLTHECGFEEVTAEEVKQLLDVHDQPLSNQELEELMEELERHESENLEEGEKEDKKNTMGKP